MFRIMCSEAVDVPDPIPLHELVYVENKVERSPWKFCNPSELPRSEVAFFVQAFASLLVTFCLITLAFCRRCL